MGRHRFMSISVSADVGKDTVRICMCMSICVYMHTCTLCFCMYVITICLYEELSQKCTERRNTVDAIGHY